MEIRSLVIEYQSLAFKLIETLLLQAKKTPSSSGQLSSPQLSKIESSESITHLLLEKDKELQLAVERIIEHQQFQKQVHEIQKEIENYDQAIQKLVSDLRTIEKNLISIVEEGKKQIQRMENAETSALPPHEIVSYSRRISYTTGPNWQSKLQAQTENPILLGYLPPTPKEEEMRSGILYQTPTSSLLNFLNNNGNK